MRKQWMSKRRKSGTVAAALAAVGYSPFEVKAIYTDGGVVGRNPSPIGGTFAWCHVDRHGLRLATNAGILKPEPALVHAISSNVMELYALIECLLALPAEWYGVVGCDSMITIGRVFDSWQLAQIPNWLIARLGQALRHVDIEKCKPVLLAGHPTQGELDVGFSKKRQLAVSIHNVWCDAECNEQKRFFK